MNENASTHREFGGHDPGRPAAEPDSLHICAILPEVETAHSTLQCAIAASKGFAADISAVHVGFDPKRSFVDPEEQDIQQLRALYEGAPEVRTARIKAVVDAFVASTQDSTQDAGHDAPKIVWRDDEGDIAANVALHAYAASLVVIGRPIHMDAADALRSALFGAQRLVLVAPRDVSEPERALGSHVVIGWKPGNSIEQTIEAAMPWLRKAEKISVVWTAKPGAAPYHASARVFFDRIGLNVEIVRLEMGRQNVGAQLLAESRRLGGDCLLIGAFRHGALWESILGGVTRYILNHTEIPVFMMRAK